MPHGIAGVDALHALGQLNAPRLHTVARSHGAMFAGWSSRETRTSSPMNQSSVIASAPGLVAWMVGLTMLAAVAPIGVAYAGVDVVSLANNHVLDHGVSGLLETLESLRAAGLRTVGAGGDETEAWAPATVAALDRGLAIAAEGESALRRLFPLQKRRQLRATKPCRQQRPQRAQRAGRPRQRLPEPRRELRRSSQGGNPGGGKRRKAASG